jgi:TDG/mug DNA glycosylase family protein
VSATSPSPTSASPTAPTELDVAPERLPLALAELHRGLPVGGVLDLAVGARGGLDRSGLDDDRLRDLLVGAGFEPLEPGPAAPRRAGAGAPGRLVARARRARTLPDTVGAGMRLLVCGLNPSLYAADAGVGFARPGNRFWPAALAAGLVTVDRDPDHALRHHGVGMTDIVKRATVAADELTTAEYRSGLTRVERLVRWLRPDGVCFIGLAGWRAAVDRRAQPGLQPGGLADVPAYVMPSTSGLNARTSLGELRAHLRAAAALARVSRPSRRGAPGTRRPPTRRHPSTSSTAPPPTGR